MLEHLTEYFQLAHRYNSAPPTSTLVRRLALEQLANLATRTKSERLRFKIYSMTGAVHEQAS